MSKTITISIQNPCSQSWDIMEQRSIGRHCNSCNKTVVDFTNFTDEQLINFFQKSEGTICGRIEENRLNTPLVLPTLPKRNRLQWLFPLTTILSIFGIGKVKAQSDSNSNQTTQLKNTFEKVAFDENNRVINFKPKFIEIEVLDKRGMRVEYDNLKVKCYGYDSLKYTIDSGLIIIPTSQFKTDEDVEIGIYNQLNFKVLLINQYSKRIYQVVLEERINAEIITEIMPKAIGGCVSVSQSSQGTSFRQIFYLDRLMYMIFE